jgi:hypothetical protein
MRSNAEANEISFLQTAAGDLGLLLDTQINIVMSPQNYSKPIAWLVTEDADVNNLSEISRSALWDEYDEGYAINMMPDVVAFAGKDVKGLWYATRMIYQVFANANDHSPAHPVSYCYDITNWPDFKLRGMHLPLQGNQSNTDLNFVKSLIRASALYHYNTLIVDVFDSLQFDNYPIASCPNALTKSQVGELVQLGKQYGLNVIPGINSLGHAQAWLFQEDRLSNPNYRDTVLSLVEDVTSPDVRRERTLCPNYSEVDSLLFGIYDELIELFEPNSFFVGLDEAFDWCECPRCVGKIASTLFKNHVNKLNNYLKGRNLRMLMFQDMLLESGAWPVGTPMHSYPPNSTSPAYSRIDPNNILMICWQYWSFGSDGYPAFNYINNGFTSAGMTWYRTAENTGASSATNNIRTYSQWVKNNGGEGMFGSTWSLPHNMPLGGGMRTLPYHLGVYVRGGDAFWSCTALPPVDSNGNERYTPEIEMERYYSRHFRQTDSNYVPVNINQWRNWDLYDPYANDGQPAAFDFGPKKDLSSLITCDTGLDGIPYSGLNTGKGIALYGPNSPNYNAPVSVNDIEINREVLSILFMHTCGRSVPFVPATETTPASAVPVAEYIIHYEDGTTATQQVVYARDILSFDSELYIYTNLDTERIWPSFIGRVPGGLPMRVHTLKWTNLKPTVKVESIDLLSLQTIASPVTLAITVEVGEKTCEDLYLLNDPSLNPADFNHDCRVDFQDFAIFASSWLECINPADTACIE